jgi:Major capsid protein N-terminus
MIQSPRITFFKHMYPTHTPFQVRSVELKSNLAEGCCSDAETIELPKRHGDMLSMLSLVILSDEGNAYRIFDRVDLRIGSTVIQTHTSEFIEIWNAVGNTSDRKVLLDRMARGVNGKMMFPLKFWFCDRPNFALSLNAFTEPLFLDVYTKHKKLLDLLAVRAEYFILGTEEKTLQARPHDILLERVIECQRSVEAGETHVALSLIAEPGARVKELFWVVPENVMVSCRIHWRDGVVDGDRVFFEVHQPSRFHTAAPPDGVSCHSFSLDPESIHPQGCVGSPISLELSLAKCNDPYTIRAYAIVYDVFCLRPTNCGWKH